MSGEIIKEDGYYYCVDKTAGNKKYVFRKKKFSKNCPVRGIKILNNPLQFNPGMRHTHAYDLLSNDVKRFRDELKTASKQHFYSTDDIYFTISKSHPDEVSTRVPYKIVKTAMRNHQKKISVSLPILTTYSKVVEFLATAEHQKLKEHTENKYIKLSNVGEDALLLGGPGIAALSQFDTLHISSTTKILPAFGNTRILTFLLGQYEHYAFPIGIVLWAQQTAEVCTEMLNQIKHFLLPNINLLTIYVDFDLKLVVEEIFPESNIHGSYNNYCRILYCESHQRNVRIVNSPHEEFLKNCFCLILLPHEKVEEGFNELVNALTRDENLQLANFIQYFRTTWIQGVGPRSMSLHENASSLNTVPVLFWTSLQNSMGEKPSLWKFLEQFVIIVNKCNKELRRLEEKKNAHVSTAVPIHFCFSRKLMTGLWQCLNKSKITIQQFLKTAASYQMDHYYDLLHHAEFLRDEQWNIYPQLPDEVNLEVYSEEEEEVVNVEFADYSLENDAPENEDEDLEEPRDDPILQEKCPLCITGLLQIIVLPCRHYHMCQVCSDKVQQIAREKGLPLKCPFCNEPAQMFGRVF